MQLVGPKGRVLPNEHMSSPTTHLLEVRLKLRLCYASRRGKMTCPCWIDSESSNSNCKQALKSVTLVRWWSGIIPEQPIPANNLWLAQAPQQKNMHQDEMSGMSAITSYTSTALRTSVCHNLTVSWSESHRKELLLRINQGTSWDGCDWKRNISPVNEGMAIDQYWMTYFVVP